MKKPLPTLQDIHELIRLLKEEGLEKEAKEFENARIEGCISSEIWDIRKRVLRNIPAVYLTRATYAKVRDFIDRVESW